MRYSSRSWWSNWIAHRISALDLLTVHLLRRRPRAYSVAASYGRQGPPAKHTSLAAIPRLYAAPSWHAPTRPRAYPVLAQAHVPCHLPLHIRDAGHHFVPLGLAG